MSGRSAACSTSVPTESSAARVGAARPPSNVAAGHCRLADLRMSEILSASGEDQQLDPPAVMVLSSFGGFPIFPIVWVNGRAEYNAKRHDGSGLDGHRFSASVPRAGGT